MYILYDLLYVGTMAEPGALLGHCLAGYEGCSRYHVMAESIAIQLYSLDLQNYINPARKMLQSEIFPS